MACGSEQAPRHEVLEDDVQDHGDNLALCHQDRGPALRSPDQYDRSHEPSNRDIIEQLHKMGGGQSGITKFLYRHEVAWEYRDLQEAEGARSSSSNSVTLGRGVSGAFPADRSHSRSDRR